MIRLDFTRVLVLSMLMATLGVTHHAAAQANLINQCTADCSRGTCIPGDFTPGGLQQCFRRCRAGCERSLRTEILRPNYYLMTIIYAPPGCTSSTRFPCPLDKATVTYDKKSSIGSTTSITNSFRSGIDLTVERSLSFAGINLFDVTSTTGFSTSASRTNALTVSKSESEKISVQGGGDGIDHGQDVFVILLNPAVVVQTVDQRSNWNMGLDGPSAVLLHVTASELKNPSTMPPNVLRELRRRGLTDADFKTILAQNPPANGQTAIDPARFVRTRWTFSYRPPVRSVACNGGFCPCAGFRNTVTNEFLKTQTTTASAEYTTSLQTQASLLGLNDRDHFTFTSTASQTSSTSSSNEAEAVIACPSPGYNGPVLLDVYWDAVYSSFMFAPNTDRVIREGVITDASGAPLRQEEIAVTFDGETHFTVTDDEGRFRVGTSGSAPTAEGQLVVRDTRQRVVSGTTAPTRVPVSGLR